MPQPMDRLKVIRPSVLPGAHGPDAQAPIALSEGWRPEKTQLVHSIMSFRRRKGYGASRRTWKPSVRFCTDFRLYTESSQRAGRLGADVATVMVVDDNPTMVEMLSMALNIFGHNALAAYSGEEALERIPEHLPDLVLLDLTMPGIDGYETLRRLRACPETEELPVYVITAAAELDLEERVLLAGGTGLLHKPIQMETLADLVENHSRAELFEQEQRTAA
jgi:CheY-like chemotaxis protein